MGFDSIAANLIMFIAVITVASFIVGLFNTYIQETSATLTLKKNKILEKVETDFDIINIDFNSTLNRTVAYALNTGSRELKPEELFVFIDGSLVEKANYNITLDSDSNIENPSLWDPKEILIINISMYLDNTTRHKLKLVYSNGVSAEEMFN